MSLNNDDAGVGELVHLTRSERWGDAVDLLSQWRGGNGPGRRAGVAEGNWIHWGQWEVATARRRQAWGPVSTEYAIFFFAWEQTW